MSKFGVVFPGQGSQAIGMLLHMAEGYNSILETFAEASEALDFDLWQLCQQGPEERLNQTEFTQPAVLAADVALWRVWRQQDDAQPAVMVGHSLGEYAALVAAEAIEFTDAIRLVSARGRFMQQAVPEGTGAMAAIVGASDEQVQALCDAVSEGQVLALANYNTMGQIVVAGNKEAVLRAVEQARQFGAKLAKVIPVSVPAHCSLMQPAADKLAVELAAVDISAPVIPVLHNADLLFHAEADEIRQALVSQMVRPVQWVKSMQQCVADGIAHVVECGPGKVLQGLNRRAVKELTTYVLSQPDSFDSASEAVKELVK